MVNDKVYDINVDWTRKKLLMNNYLVALLKVQKVSSLSFVISYCASTWNFGRAKVMDSLNNLIGTNKIEIKGDDIISLIYEEPEKEE